MNLVSRSGSLDLITMGRITDDFKLINQIFSTVIKSNKIHFQNKAQGDNLNES